MSKHPLHNKIAKAGLDSLMKDPRYFDGNHPEHASLVDLVQRGFQMIFDGPEDRKGSNPRVTGPAPRPGLLDQFMLASSAERDRFEAAPTEERRKQGRSVMLAALKADGFPLPSGLREEAGLALKPTAPLAGDTPRPLAGPGTQVAALGNTGSRLPPGDQARAAPGDLAQNSALAQNSTGASRGRLTPPKAPPGANRANSDQDQDDMDQGADIFFRAFREGLEAREGGFVNNPKDPGGPTQKGMSQRTLDELRQRPEWGHLPAKSKDLSDGQIENIFRKEFFEQPKVDKLTRIPGLMSKTPKLAEQVFDTGILNSPKKAGVFLQRALDETMGTNLREFDPDEPDEGTYDGNIGPKTREVLARAVEQGKADEVNDRMIKWRKDHFRTLEKFGDFGRGWLARAESFRIGKRTP